MVVGAIGLDGLHVLPHVKMVNKFVLEHVPILYLLTVVVNAPDNPMDLRVATTNLVQVNLV